MASSDGRIKRFLDSFQSKNTRLNYRSGLKQFFVSVYGENGDLEEKAEKYFSEQRDFEEDIQDFIDTFNGSAPKTIRLRLASVKTFLLDNDVELPQKFWRKIGRKIKGNRALTLDRVPGNKELREMFTHMPIQGLALYQLLASSGMRIGEALQLQVTDVKIDQKPGLIEIRGEYTKTGNSRYAFISREAVEALTQWLNVRDDYLRAAVAKSHLYAKKAGDKRIFPFMISAAYSIWTKALKKSKKDQRDNNTNRYKVHPHVLRKFFRTKLATLIPVDIVEALMGHEGYLTEVYRRYAQEDLAKFYLKGESALLVFTETQDLTQLRKELEEKTSQQKDLVNGLAAQNFELRSKVENLTAENREITNRILKIENKVSEIADVLRNMINKSKET
jgi:integrase